MAPWACTGLARWQEYGLAGCRSDTKSAWWWVALGEQSMVISRECRRPPANPPPGGDRGVPVSSDGGPVPPHSERVPPAVYVTGPSLPDAPAILAELPVKCL